MNVFLEPDFITRTVKVWVTRGGEGRTSLLRVTDYVDPVSWRWDDIDAAVAGEERLPTLVLPEDVLKALVSAGADALPPDRAQAAHLADAIKVRDTLLGLVVDAHPRRRGS